MGFAVLCLLTFRGAQGQLEKISFAQYRSAVTAGQREIALGVMPQRDVTMQVRFEKTIPAEFTSSTTFGETLIEYSRGYVRWSVTDGVLFDQPCRILKMDGITKGVHHFKTKRQEYASRNQTTYWVTSAGKILRQSVHTVDPADDRNAECTFAADHIDVSVSDGKGRRSFTVYPSMDLSLLDMQFKPMVSGTKVLMPTKEYYVFEPFNQGFIKYKATVAGTFHGTWLATKFDGLHVGIEGPEGKTIAYVSQEGDLVKADLINSEELVLDNLPASRDPLFKAFDGALGRVHF
jgi:hypothetical protein